MSAPSQPRTSAAKAGWLIGLLFAGWLVFLLAPRTPEPPPPGEPVAPRQPTRLAALGLEDISDLEQVPEMFAVWADYGDWQDDRTYFAYWSPGARDYVYKIEARRTSAGYRFRMTQPPADFELGDELAPDCPLRFYRSPRIVTSLPAKTRMVRPEGVTGPAPPADIKIDLPTQPAKK